MNLVDKVYDYSIRNNLLSKGDSVLIGVSGGADSVALLFVMQMLGKRIGFDISAIHIEHGIRGEESLNDADYVRNLCNNLNVNLKTVHVNALKYADDNHLTTEEAARILRYKAFDEAMDELSFGKIAVAHHMDDQAETVLFNMIRGSGIRGISGIRPKNGRIIRPFLCIRRFEIIELLDSLGVSYCVDATNSDVTYSRNRIRCKVIPQLLYVSDASVEHIAREASELAETDEFISGMSDKLYNECVTIRCRNNREEYVLDIQKINDSPRILKRYVIKTVIFNLEKRWKDVSFVNIEDVIGLMNKQSGRKIDLPRRYTCQRTGNELVFYKKDEPCDSKVKPTSNVLEDGAKVAFMENIVSARVFERDNSEDFPVNSYTKWFDYDKIKNDVLVRNRQQGDYIVIDNNGNRQSLKKFLICNKIPADERDNVILIASGSEIMWVVGYRMGHSCRVDENTHKIMEITVKGGQCYE